MDLKKLAHVFFSATLALVMLAGCGSDNLPGSSSTATTTALLSNGVTTASTSLSTGDSTVTVASGTTLKDVSGAALSGSSANLTLTYANDVRFLPSGASQLPAKRSLTAYIDLIITSGSQTVKTFSQPVTVTLNLTGSGVAPGDAVSLFSYSGTAWSTGAEGVAIVDANYKVTFSISHLSIWAALKPSSALFTSSAFLADLSSLTKSYIPPLFYTNLPAANTTQAVAADAQKSLTRLITVWGDFKTKYKSSAEFAAYSAKFDEVDTKIAAAGTIIQTAIASGSAANDLLAAHEALEVIRQNLLDMDRGNGFDYPIDAIKDFHDGMEPFALAVKGKTAATLTDADVATLKTMFTIVESTWNKVTTYQINKDQFGMTAEVKAFIDAATTSQTGNLKALKAALFAATPDKAVIATNGNNVKPLFLKLFFSFADFIKPFDADLVSADAAAATAVTATAKTAATAADVTAAVTALTALESGFNKFKTHFATQPISIMTVLTWYSGSTTAPLYFDKIGAAISSAKTQLTAIQTAAVYPVDLTAVNTQMQIYKTEMDKLKARMNYK